MLRWKLYTPASNADLSGRFARPERTATFVHKWKLPSTRPSRNIQPGQVATIFGAANVPRLTDIIAKRRGLHRPSCSVLAATTSVEQVRNKRWSL